VGNLAQELPLISSRNELREVANVPQAGLNRNWVAKYEKNGIIHAGCSFWQSL
jgi:hypothetical protein